MQQVLVHPLKTLLDIKGYIEPKKQKWVTAMFHSHLETESLKKN
jgi:hypothetical protein